MNEKTLFHIRLYFTGIVILAIGLLLVWNHFHGGVSSHHILHRKDLPAISNWWSGVLLPLLTWFLLYRIQKRILRHMAGKPDASKYLTNIIYGFVGALLFGILLAAFFTFGYFEILGYMVNGLLLLGMLFPTYRAEYLLGFVIGMTYTFGAVLPTAFGVIFAMAGAVLYLLIRPASLHTGSWFMRLRKKES